MHPLSPFSVPYSPWLGIPSLNLPNLPSFSNQIYASSSSSNPSVLTLKNIQILSISLIPYLLDHSNAAPDMHRTLPRPSFIDHPPFQRVHQLLQVFLFLFIPLLMSLFGDPLLCKIGLQAQYPLLSVLLKRTYPLSKLVSPGHDSSYTFH